MPGNLHPHHHKHHTNTTKNNTISGWTPVLSAMVISSLGGGILSSTIASFPDIAVFQPVINGVAGNLVLNRSQ